MPTIENFNRLRELALIGVESYLLGNGSLVNDGLYHSDAGMKRAKKVKRYLSFLPDANHPDYPNITLAVLLAIYGKPTTGNSFFCWNWVVGRSSRLAGLISEQFFTGSLRLSSYNANYYNNSSTPTINTLTPAANLMSSQAFTAIRNDNRSFTGDDTYSPFNNAKAVRVLLEKALLEMKPGQREKIEAAANLIKKKIDDEKLDINFNADLAPLNVRMPAPINPHQAPVAAPSVDLLNTIVLRMKS